MLPGRTVILSPNRSGIYMPEVDHQHVMKALHALPGVEVMTADATTPTVNGMMYADFFDFN